MSCHGHSLTMPLRHMKAGIPARKGDGRMLRNARFWSGSSRLFRLRTVCWKSASAVDLTVFVTTVEFLDTPELALSEAMRIARHGIVLVVLNRWSRGGYSRRWGAQAQRTLLSQAHDYSLPALQAFVKRAAGPRLKKIFWSSTLFPGVLWKYRGSIPFGDVIGLAAVFSGSQERERLTQPAALPALFSRTSLMLFNGGCCLDGTGVCHY